MIWTTTISVVVAMEVHSGSIGAAEVSWVVTWVICTKPMYAWMSLEVSAVMTSLVAMPCL